jgi:hypothetical protein
VQNLIFQKLQTFAQLRQQLSAFHGDVPVALIETGHPTVLTLKRGHDVMACFNFSRHAVAHAVENGQAIALKPYGFAWLQKKPNKTLQTLID